MLNYREIHQPFSGRKAHTAHRITYHQYKTGGNQTIKYRNKKCISKPCRKLSNRIRLKQHSLIICKAPLFREKMADIHTLVCAKRIAYEP